MNKGELVEAIAGDTGMAKSDVEKFLRSFIDQVQSAVAKGEKVTLPGFGAWSRTERKERMQRNPRTGEMVRVPASLRPKFSVGAQFKSAVSDT